MYVVTPVVAIEITRKCNLACKHCMRGEAENCHISQELLEKLFDEVKSANALVITGGEPFLCFEQIKMLVDIIKQKQVRIPKIILVTNGTIFDKRIYDLLSSSFFSFEINISCDSYHINSIEEIYTSSKISKNPCMAPINIDEVLANIDFHKSSEHFNEFYGEIKYLIDMGRARNLNCPKRPFRALGYFYSDCMPGLLIAGPRIYLDCLGYITEGDSEYAHRERISIGNLNDTSLVEMLTSGAIKIDAQSGEEFNDFLAKRETDYSIRQENDYEYKNYKLIEIDSGQARARKNKL